MKVNFPAKNKIPPLNKILQLQLILELSQLQELLSAYSDFLLFFAEYSFIFETSPTDTLPLKSTYTPSDTSFSSQDPARDGGNWWNYCKGNPVTHIDLTGLEEEKIKFDYNNYFEGRLYGECLLFKVRLQDLIGKTKNYFSNIFIGKGKYESFSSISVSIGTYEYQATMYIDSMTSNISFEFPNATDDLINALMQSMGAPVSINTNDINGEIPLGSYYTLSLSVPVSLSSKDDCVSLKLGLKGSIGSPISDSVKGSGTLGCRITAPVQDGPHGTIKNRKNKSLNNIVYKYQYYCSEEFAEEFIQ